MGTFINSRLFFLALQRVCLSELLWHVVTFILEDEAISPCLENSPKSRRKISKPKHYKPTANGQDIDEHNGISQTPADLDGSTYSPESVIQEQRAERVPENAVHVLTASHGGKKADSSTAKRASSQKPKRTSSTGKSSNKKGKNDTPTVPRKPEDLIKEAMMMGQSAPPASKRDAQYRKSYAYKIWKERGSQELKTDTTEGNGVNTAKNKLPPGIIVKRLGPVVQSWISANPGLKFNPLF